MPGLKTRVFHLGKEVHIHMVAIQAGCGSASKGQPDRGVTHHLLGPEQRRIERIPCEHLRQVEEHTDQQ